MNKIGRSYARWGSLFVFLLMINGAFVFVATDNASALTDGDYVYTTSLSKGGYVATITGYTGDGGHISIPSTMGAFDYPVRVIGAEAFRNQDSLIGVTIPNGVTSIREYAFYECDALNAIIIPNSVTNIGTSAFEGCEDLIGVTLHDGVKTIGDRAFFNCDSLFSAILGSGVTTIGDYAFSYCGSLTEISVSPDNSYFASSLNLLYNKAMTTLIYCPGGKSGSLTIPSSVTSIGKAAFHMCHHLTSVTIPNSVTAIGSAAFYGCDSMATVNIPDGITTIEALTFYHCSALNSITIPDGVTSILDDAFSSCTSLTSVTVPSTVTTIGDWVFNRCTSLASIIFTGLVAPVNVGGQWIQNTNPGLRGHAYPASNFPPPGGIWNGLTMGTVIPPTLPGAPTGLTVIPRDAHVTMSWTAPADNGGAVIDHYVVYQNGLDILHVSGTSTTVTGLTNGVSYNFAVAAHNSAGTGPMSPVVSTMPTLPLTVAVPPDAPTGLTTTPGDGQVQLSWTAPADNGGAVIDHYVVYLNGTDTDHVSGTSTTVIGLTNDVSYNFAVAAHNSAGIGDMSTVVSATPSATATVPDSPTDLTATPGDGQVLLSWNPPVNNGGQAITGYRIYWGSDPNSSYGPILVNGTSYLHEGLENGETLYYWVAAINSVGEGESSDVVSATPGGTLHLPSAPTGLVASIVNGNVSLIWTASPSTQNVTGYKVYRGTSVSSIQEVGSVVVTTFMDNTVSNDQTYYYQVSAINEMGEGNRSEAVNVTLTSSAAGPSFLDTIEGQLAIGGAVVAVVGVAGYMLWRRKRP